MRRVLDPCYWAIGRGLIDDNGTLTNNGPNYMWSDFVTR